MMLLAPASRIAAPRRSLGHVVPTLEQTTRLAALARRFAGLNLKPEKIDFFTQRLGAEQRRAGFEDFGQYAHWIEHTADADGRRRFVEALTTHTTQFFREPAHFEWLHRTGWSALTETGAGITRPLTIWSAAASAGQELYSALMSVQDWSARERRALRISGVGTDISTQILKTAERGVYDGEAIASMAVDQRKRHLLRARDGSDRFRIAPEIRRLSHWQHANLTDLGSAGPAHCSIIFIRNVLIYFDRDTQARVIQALVNRLEPGGILLTGHSEALSSLPDGLSQVTSATYRKTA